MTRLDVWLVENGHFSSRQAAKRAIREGHVLVNGIPAKASKQVSGMETILVSEEAVNHPQGYSKLSLLNDTFQNRLVTPDTRALDLGSSAGGFLAYLAEKGGTSIGVEISEEFAEPLKNLVERYSNISVIMDDAFTLDPQILAKEGEIDLLLVDITSEPESTIKLIERFSPLLRNGGWMVAAFKIKPNAETLSRYSDLVKNLGFEEVQDIVLHVSRQEFHLVAKRH
jgi:23S rRNA (cytidine1920-2'-O)/16S rRNA (cytidine1409-2'-O)-methyltransferase